MNEYLGTSDKKILVMLMEKIVMIGSAKDLECVQQIPWDQRAPRIIK